MKTRKNINKKTKENIKYRMHKRSNVVRLKYISRKNRKNCNYGEITMRKGK